MTVRWFDTEEAVAFARGIAKDVNHWFPGHGKQREKAISPKKEQAKLDGIALRTRSFAQRHKLNVYKKAKLLNTIKWELRDAGREEAFVNEIVALVTRSLT